MTCNSYTHYYNVKCWNSEEWQQAWPQLIKDVPHIISAAEVDLCGDEDEEDSDPIVDIEEGIDLNGVGDEGHENLVFLWLASC